MLRYQQQILLPEIGLIGQEKLKQSKVLVIGAGGLGTPVVMYLAAMGIGWIGIVDFDIIQESNLHRQILYTETDVGKSKVEVLSARIKNQNSEVQIDSIYTRLSVDNAKAIIQQYNIICDCSDNVSTRLLVDEICFNFQTPLVYGAVRGWQGYLTIFNAKKKIRLLDVFSKEDLINESKDNCGTSGIVSTVCGIIGSYQATEIIKLILEINSDLDGSILCFDALQNITTTLKFKPLTLKNYS